MIRKYLNSKIMILDGSGEANMDNMLNGIFIIQVEPVNNRLIMEYCSNNEIIDLIPFVANMPTVPKQAPEGDAHKVEEYRSCIINNDPFRKYSGFTLGEIFDNKDIKWLNKCISEMKNTFIKDRVEYLVNYYKSRGEI